MKVPVVNKSKLEISIKDYYRLVDGGSGGETTGYYGSVHYTLKPDEKKSIDPSHFKRLSKEMFAPVEVRVCGGRDNQFISFSPLQFDNCDQIVINADKDGKLTHKFIERNSSASSSKPAAKQAKPRT